MITQMFADPQVRHRRLVQYASDPELGEVPHIRTPIRIGEGVRVRNVAPKLGEHNAEIFGRLGVSKGELQKLCNFWVRPFPDARSDAETSLCGRRLLLFGRSAR
jgi:crotonobetainyl-CoA:carnitine CoA-transferase CaiB-like acyl-CoA transferase